LLESSKVRFAYIVVAEEIAVKQASDRKKID